MKRLFTCFQYPLTRWLFTLLWTVITIPLMLSPSGEGTSVSWIAKLFGNTEASNAVGHVIVNAILAFLWYWTINMYLCDTKTMWIILISGIIWGIIGEMAQVFVPARGPSLLDLGMNILGVLIGVFIYHFSWGLHT